MSGSLFSPERFESSPQKPSKVGHIVVWVIAIAVPVGILVYLPYFTKPELPPPEPPPGEPEPVISTPAAVPVYQPGMRVDFTKPSSNDYLPSGWYKNEAENRWSGKEAVIRFKLEKPEPLLLRLHAITFHEQEIVVGLNGQEVGTLRGQLDFKDLELPIRSGWIADTNTITLKMPEARSPHSIGESDDVRVLGIGVAWMELLPQ
jgi:hypothetical protein